MTLCLFAGPCVAQQASQNKTTGACSPIISGSSSAKVTITCTSMSAKSAAEMTRLMNKLLQDKISPDVVYRQLDEIKQQMSKLDAAVDPLAQLKPDVVATLASGRQLFRRCELFYTRWDHDGTESFHEGRGTIGVTDAYRKTYTTELYPDLVAWQTKLFTASPGLRRDNLSFLAVHYDEDVDAVCSQVKQLYEEYYESVTGKSTRELELPKHDLFE